MAIRFSPSTGTYWDTDSGEQVSEFFANAAKKDASGVGSLEAGAVGAGRAVQNMVKAVTPESMDDYESSVLGQLVGLLPGNDRTTMPNDMEYNAIKEQSPFATAVGETIPAIAGPAKGGPILQAGYGGLMGGLQADPGSTDIGATLGAFGGAAGDLIGRMAGRVTNAIRGFGDEPMTQTARELTESGYRLSPAEKSGKEGYKRIERRLSKTAKGQQITGDMGEANEQLLLDRANEAIGRPAGSGALDRNALDLRAEQIGQGMRDVADGVDINVSDELADRLDTIISNDKMLEIPQIKDGGLVSGPEYMKIRSALSEAQRSARDSSQGYIKRTIRQMDELFENQAPEESVKAYRVLREQYKNLSLLEKGQSITSDGLVNVRSFKNALRSKQGYGKRGVDNTLPATKQLISDTENLASRSVNPQIGNSGTSEGMNSLLDWKNWAESAGAGKYYDGGMSLSGILEAAPAEFPAIGANIGRAGLLGAQ